MSLALKWSGIGLIIRMDKGFALGTFFQDGGAQMRIIGRGLGNFQFSIFLISSQKTSRGGLIGAFFYMQTGYWKIQFSLLYFTIQGPSVREIDFTQRFFLRLIGLDQGEGHLCYGLAVRPFLFLLNLLRIQVYMCGFYLIFLHQLSFLRKNQSLSYSRKEYRYLGFPVTLSLMTKEDQIQMTGMQLRRSYLPNQTLGQNFCPILLRQSQKASFSSSIKEIPMTQRSFVTLFQAMPNKIVPDSELSKEQMVLNMIQVFQGLRCSIWQPLNQR